MKKLSVKIKLALFLFAYLIFIAIRDGDSAFLFKSIISVTACIFVESLIQVFKSRKFKIHESSLVTGLILGFVISAYDSWWLFTVAPTVAILSKYLIRVKSRHIFNPAALGAFIAILFFDAMTQWKGAYFWYLIIPFGIYFTLKIKKQFVVLSYGVVYFLTFGLESLFFRADFINTILYANYFFIFVMLIEPKTSPNSKGGQVLFGVIVGLTSFLLYCFGYAYDSALPSLLIGNLFFLAYRLKFKGG